MDSYLILVQFDYWMELRGQLSLPVVRVDPEAKRVHQLALGIHLVVNLLAKYVGQLYVLFLVFCETINRDEYDRVVVPVTPWILALTQFVRNEHFVAVSDVLDKELFSYFNFLEQAS